ncbi:hypothetical protein STENM327S_02097 [Streptomyces tendae]
MCRSIKTLRPPVLAEEATEDEIRAAALQYVRKVSGFRAPAAHNQEVFDEAVEAVAKATAELLAGLEIREAPERDGPPDAGPAPPAPQEGCPLPRAGRGCRPGRRFGPGAPPTRCSSLGRPASAASGRLRRYEASVVRG